MTDSWLSNRGRPKTISKFGSIKEYLEGYLFPIKDNLIELRELERKKEKEFLSAQGRRKLQEQKLNRAYEGLEQFRGGQ